MHNIATPIPVENVASLIGWWRDAGVDTLIDDVPTSWLDRNKLAEKLPAAPPAPIEQGLPNTLEAFKSWWMSDNQIAGAGPVQTRVAPTGAALPQVMILIDMPEPGDHQEGMLLAGPCGILIDNMLKAVGLDRSHAYITSLSPSRALTGKIAEGEIPALAKIAAHHVGLVAPERLWLMGSTVSRAMLGTDDSEARGILHNFNHESGTVPAIASFAPRFLLQHPAQKARVWADMQLLFKRD